MKITITDYTIDGDDKPTHDPLEVDLDLEKTGPDPDVIEMWIMDECLYKHGLDIMPDFTIANANELEEAVKAMYAKA